MVAIKELLISEGDTLLFDVLGPSAACFKRFSLGPGTPVSYIGESPTLVDCVVLVAYQVHKRCWQGRLQMPENVRGYGL